MIELYAGELFLLPAPLELSMGQCSHCCRYCFSVLQGYKGWDGRAPLLRQLEKVSKGEIGKSSAKALLKLGYPTCISNRSDPFADSNRKDTDVVLRAMAAKGLPVFIQTKGGEGAMEAVRAGYSPPSVWYVSISFWAEAQRHRFEPHAPSIASRRELIEALRDKGHRVIVGLNPLEREWISEPELEQMATWLKGVGAEGVFIQPCSLRGDSASYLSEGGLELFKNILARKGRSYPKDVVDYCYTAHSIFELSGLETMSHDQWWPSKLFDCFAEVYDRSLPTTQDFVNWAFENKQTGDELQFEDFVRVMAPRLPEGVFRLRDHLFSCSRAIAREMRDSSGYFTFFELARIIWNDYRHPRNPVHRRCFAFRSLDSDSYEVDNDGDAVIVFSKEGFSNIYT